MVIEECQILLDQRSYSQLSHKGKENSLITHHDGEVTIGLLFSRPWHSRWLKDQSPVNILALAYGLLSEWDLDLLNQSVGLVKKTGTMSISCTKWKSLIWDCGFAVDMYRKCLVIVVILMPIGELLNCSLFSAEKHEGHFDIG